MRESQEPSGFRIVPADPHDASVAALLRKSEQYAHALYPPESVHMLSIQELLAPHVHFMAASDAQTGEALGCCALVMQPCKSGELKRMYVQSPADMRVGRRSDMTKLVRRRGVGAALMAKMEELARAEGLEVLRFETGPSQPHAIALGHRFGYVIRGPFGDYPDDPNSVFMEKRL
jgi:putative acetyltransferase